MRYPAKWRQCGSWTKSWTLQAPMQFFYTISVNVRRNSARPRPPRVKVESNSLVLYYLSSFLYNFWTKWNWHLSCRYFGGRRIITFLRMRLRPWWLCEWQTSENSSSKQVTKAPLVHPTTKPTWHRQFRSYQTSEFSQSGFLSYSLL